MAARLLNNSRVMILGGAGLAGYSIARRLALLPIRPAQIIVASRTRDEALQAVEKLRQEQDERSAYIPQLSKQPKLHFIPEWGDIYLRHSLAHIPRYQLEEDPVYRAALLKDIYGDVEEAYEQSHLVHLLRKRRPNIVIDAVNTATGLSYQNAFQAASKVQQTLGDDTGQLAENAERLLLAQSVPSLVRHVTILAKAAKEIGTLEQYLKIGTTGTGGMGLNLPYTHSESQPSHLVLAKNEAAFGHTGLLFLWSRTPGAPAIREIKRAYLHPVYDAKCSCRAAHLMYFCVFHSRCQYWLPTNRSAQRERPIWQFFPSTTPLAAAPRSRRGAHNQCSRAFQRLPTSRSHANRCG